MANQTLTNTSANYDHATYLGLNNGETFTINNSTLIIDSDVRWNQQAAIFGNLTISSTLGGQISITADKTWEIPFGGTNEFYYYSSILFSSDNDICVDMSRFNNKVSNFSSNHTLYSYVGSNSLYCGNYKIDSIERFGLIDEFSIEDLQNNVDDCFYTYSSSLSSAEFGYSIAINYTGNYLIIGTNDKNIVYIYKKNGEKWKPIEIIQAPDINSNFGSKLSLGYNDSILVITDKMYDTVKGKAYVYSLDADFHPTYINSISLSPSSIGDLFGYDVCVSKHSNYIAIGAYGATVGGISSCGSVSIYTISGSTITLQTTLTASDKAASDNFGSFLSIDNNADRIVVNSPKKTVGGISGAGAAYIFSRSGSVWTQEAIISASDKATNDNFGHDIKINGDGTVIAASSRVKTVATIVSAGQVYLYTRTGVTWTEKYKASASDKNTNYYFGSTIALNNEGNTLFIGSYYRTSSIGFTGSGALYKLSFNGTTATEIDIISRDNIKSISMLLGAYSTVISEDSSTIATSVTGYDGQIHNLPSTDKGLVSVFTDLEKTINKPVSEQKLIELMNKKNNYYGEQITINSDGTEIAVAAKSEVHPTISGTNIGAVYIYRKQNDEWILYQTLYSSTAEDQGMFGNSLIYSYDGTRLIIGSLEAVTGFSGAGKVHVFTKDINNDWSSEFTILASSPEINQNFGNSIAASNLCDRLIIGAKNKDVNDVGTAYIYIRSGSTWSLESELTFSVSNSNSYIGTSVAINDIGDVVAIGSIGLINSTYTSGGVFIFTRTSSVWTERALIQSNTPHNLEGFGWDISLDSLGKKIAISANNKTVSTIANVGEVYIYSNVSGYTWTLDATINDTYTPYIANIHFGNSIRLAKNGNYLVINSLKKTFDNILIFKRNNTTWTNITKLTVNKHLDNANNNSDIDVNYDFDKIVYSEYGVKTTPDDPNGYSGCFKLNLNKGYGIRITETDNNNLIDTSNNLSISFNLGVLELNRETILISLLTNDNNYAAIQIFIDNIGRLGFRLSANGTSWGSSIVTNTIPKIIDPAVSTAVKMSKILFVKQSTTYRLFIDGVSVAAVSYSTALMNQSTNYYYEHYIGKGNAVIINELHILKNYSLKNDANTFVPKEIPWDYSYTDEFASTGNTPANLALGSNTVTGLTSGATGELLRVFSTENSFNAALPVNYNNLIPYTGFLKLRYKTGTFIEGETISLPGGGTIKALNAGKRSWIHIVGKETTTITIPRLGKLYMKGDNYYLGITNGKDNQQFQYPIDDICPALEIETEPNSNIYEIWLNADDRWSLSSANKIAMISTDIRGKFFYSNANTGAITIATRGSMNLGYKPPAGCKVRIPNIIGSSANSTNYALNVNNTTFATRYDFTTTASGQLDISNFNSNWYLSLTSPYEVKIKNSNFLNAITITNSPGLIDLRNIGLGMLNTIVGTNPVILQFNTGNIYIDNLVSSRYFCSGTSHFNFSLSDCQNIIFNNSKLYTFGNVGIEYRYNAANYGLSIARCINAEINNLVLINGPLNLNGCLNTDVNNTIYSDTLVNFTTNNIPVSAITIINASYVTINGFDNLLNNLNPYNYIFNISNSSSNITLKNIGTKDNPYIAGYDPYGYNINGLLRLLSSTGSYNVTIENIYITGLRSFLFNVNNTNSDFTFKNVYGTDILGVTAIQTVTCNNAVMRSNGYKTSVNGQSSVYGAIVHDYFTDDTTGYITFLFNEPLSNSYNKAIINNLELGFQPDVLTDYGTISTSLLTITDSLRTIEFTNYTSSGIPLIYNDFITGTYDYSNSAGTDEENYNYVEFEILNDNDTAVGVKIAIGMNETLSYYSNGSVYHTNDIHSPSTELVTTIASYTTGDVIGMTINRVTKTIKFFKNNVQVFTSAGFAITTDFTNNNNYANALVAIGTYTTTLGNPAKVAVNFGQKAFIYNIPVDFYGRIGGLNLPKYNAAGLLLIGTPGNEVTLEMSYFAVGITALDDSIPVLTSSNINTTTHDIEFKYDIGNGYIANWIPFLVSDLGTTIGAIDPTVGIKLKIRIQCKTKVEITRSITNINIKTITDVINKYTIVPSDPVLLLAKISNVIPGSRILVYNETTDTIIFNDINDTANWELYYPDTETFSDQDIVKITISYFSSSVVKLPFKTTIVASSSGWNIIAEQLDDTIYNNNLIDGSLVDGITTDNISNIYLDPITHEISIQDIYAWICYYKNTAEGIQNIIGSFTAIDSLNYRINSGSIWKLNNPNAANSVLVNAGYLYTEDGSVPIASSSNSIWFNPGRAYSASINELDIAKESTSQSILKNTKNIIGLTA